VIVPDWPTNAFHAAQQASTMALYVAKTRLDSWFCRCQMFSCGFNSGLYGGRTGSVALTPEGRVSAL